MLEAELMFVILYEPRLYIYVMNFTTVAAPATGCEILKIPEANLQPVASSASATINVAGAQSQQPDAGHRVLPVFYIQGAAPPVRVAPNTMGPQKVTTTVRPTLVTTSTQFLPTLAPKLGMNSAVSGKTTVVQPQPQPQQQHFMIQTTRPAGSNSAPSPVKNRAFAYLGTFIRPGVVKPGESSQKLLLANVPLPLSTPNGTTSTTQQPKMASLLVPMTIPAQVNTTKGSVINLKIANRHVHTDSKGPVTVNLPGISVLRETKPAVTPIGQLPPLQPISKQVPKSVSTSGGTLLPSDSSFVSVKERTQAPVPSVKKFVEEETDIKRNSQTVVEKRNQDLNRCLKEAVDAIFAPNSPTRVNEDDVTLIKVMTTKQEEPKKAMPEDEVKIEIVKPGLKKDTDYAKSDSKHKKQMKNDMPVKQEARNEISFLKQESRCDSIQTESSSEEQVMKREIKVEGGVENMEQKSVMSEMEDVKVPLIEAVDTSPEDFDPMKVLEWKDGIGTLPGSDLKFRMNEFNMMEMVDDEDYAKILNSRKCIDAEEDAKVASHPEVKNDCKELEDITNASGAPQKLPRPPGTSDEIYCCDGCGCYGLATEFVSTQFCSSTCEKVSFSKKAAESKKERELLQLRLRRRKKRLMQLLEQQKAQEFQETLPQPQNPAAVQKPVPVPPPIIPDDDAVLSEASTDCGKARLPWQTGKNGFSWTKYLDHSKAKAAPVKLFKDPFPYCKNGFKVGMKMEGIDPEHPAYYCVLTVVDVQGYRIRLNFDGYPETHDFWVNADSMDIFPAGWCEKNNHHLHPPKGYKLPTFNWSTYLKQCRAQAAPRNLFSNKTGSSICPNGFRLGMKLEAVDRKNSSLVCVATVADLMDSRILVHFDSWGDIYDYWADPSSPYIHPVGWCEEHGHVLTPPVHYKPPHTFSWEQYLKETKSQAAPARAFKQRPPCGFRRGMKLECVDKRVPMLIRVATVDDIMDHQIKIKFDGWSDEYSYWLDDDSPDIHPVGWCQKTAHSLEPPLTPEDMVESSECPTPGCLGKGHIKGPKYSNHHTIAGCPYATENLNKDGFIPDRLFGERRKQDGRSSLMRPSKCRRIEVTEEEAEWAVVNEDNAEKKLRKSEKEDSTINEVHHNLRSETRNAVGRPKFRRNEEKGKEDFDWPIEEENLGGKRKSYSEKEETSGNDTHPSVKVEARQSSSRPAKCRRVESIDDKPVLQDLDWPVQEESNVGRKKNEKEELPVGDIHIKVEGRQSANRPKCKRSEPSEEKLPMEDTEWSLGEGGSNSKRKRSHCCEDRGNCRCTRSSTRARRLPAEAGEVQKQIREDILFSAYEPNPNKSPPCFWPKHSNYLRSYITNLKMTDVFCWKPEDVSKFVKTIPGCEKDATSFLAEKVDGESFLLMAQNDLVEELGMKLGPAIKLYNCILLLRQKAVVKV